MPNFERDIISKLKNGDESILESLYKKYLPSVINYIKMNNGNEDEAKDIFQDAVIIFYEKVKQDSIDIKFSIQTYLIGICKKLWYKRFKNITKIESINEEILDIEGFDLLDIEDVKQEKINVVVECFSKLTENCKKYLNYYYWDNLDTTEIAERMNLANENTVKVGKYKCMEKLKECVNLKFNNN